LVDVTPRWETAGVSRIFEFMRAHPNGFASLEEAAAEVSRYLHIVTLRTRNGYAGIFGRAAMGACAGNGIGARSFNMPNITAADYIEPVDFTGRELHPSKRGRILESEPKALTKLGLYKNHWTGRVKGVGSGYWRFVGEWQDLLEKAKELKQRTIFGTGFAKLLKTI